MLKKLDKGTSVSQQVASFSLRFFFLSFLSFPVFSTPKTSEHKKTRFSHNEGENCGEKTRRKNNAIENEA
jgi:hypothetical protein